MQRTLGGLLLVAGCAAPGTDTGAAPSAGMGLRPGLVARPADPRAQPAAVCAPAGFGCGEGFVGPDWTEWWVPAPRGLRHGFTVEAAPGPGPLRLPIGLDTTRVEAVPGGLRLWVGGDAWTYGGLRVWDADGRPVPARLVHDGVQAEIVVEWAGARFPLVVDPVLTPAVATRTGRQVAESFGWAVVHIGDANGDGFGDVAVGAPQRDSAAGRVYLYAGNSSGLSTTPTTSILAQGSNNLLGRRLLAPGDINGDGLDDIVVAQPMYQTNFTGRVRAFHGNATSLVGAAAWTANGAASGDSFGDSLASPGDVDGDGFPDVAVGAPGVGTSAGQVSLYRGGASGLDTTAAWVYSGATNDEAATALAGGDFNGDGYGDLAVGSPGFSFDTGEVLVFFGSATGLGTSSGARLTGSLAGDRFGDTLGGAGDIDGDGDDELLVGMPGLNGGAGRVIAYAGDPSTPFTVTLQAYDGAAAADALGTALTGVGDLDADGYADIALGAPGAGDGEVWLVHGDPAGLAAAPQQVVLGVARNGLAGFSIAGPGDVNADGYDDLFIGERAHSSSLGQVHLYLGCQDIDGDGYCASGTGLTQDCDDTDPLVYPGAPEIAGDGVDQDCDGRETCLADADGDGVHAGGTVPSTDIDCTDPGEAPSSAPGGDCDDAAAAVYPGAVEVVADGVDQDCDGTEVCYTDGDADGYRTTGTVASADTDCADPGEAPDSLPAGDCDDTNAAVRPGVAEGLADGVDQNCDGIEICYADADLDGWRVGSTVSSADPDCADPGEALAAVPSPDCDDTDPLRYPGGPEAPGDGRDGDCDGLEICYVDADGDAFRTTATVSSAVVACTGPGEAAAAVPAGDCDDAAPAVNPGATERCNGIDDDCDGTVDGASAVDATAFWPDTDGDTFGDPSLPARACVAPAGHVAVDGDCDDTAADTFPGAAEACDARDNDCDGIVDDGAPADNTWHADVDGDGFGDPAAPVAACLSPGAGYVIDGTDCDDALADVYPGAPELCNRRDDDCDGLLPGESDADGDGFAGCEGDCVDADAAVGPGVAEVADGKDNDCDGTADEGTEAADDDGDGFSEAEGDCDDADPSRHPAATEAEDGRDDDCDGIVDEGLDTRDDDGDGFAEVDGDCDDTTRARAPGVAELCTLEGQAAVDEDCDGAVDEGCDPPAPKSRGGCDSSGGPGSAALALGGALWLLGRRRRARAGLAALAVGAVGCQDAALTTLKAESPPVPTPAWLDFGTLETGAAHSIGLSLRNPGAVELTVTRARIDGAPGVVLDTDVPRTVLAESGDADGADYLDLTVTFAPEVDGLADGALVFDLAGAEAEALRVPIFAAAGPAALSAAPRVLDFGEVEPGAARALRLQNGGPAAVDFLESEVPAGLRADGGEALGRLEPGATLTVTLAFEGGGPVDDTLRLVTASGAVLTVPVRVGACAEGPVRVADEDGDGFTPCGGDCDDADPAVGPAAADVAGDDRDADCDGADD